MEVKIIFAHSRYEYDSYTDYKKLVELAGFETCFVDQIDYAKENTVYITSPITGEHRSHRDGSRGKPYNARVVHWCLERPGGTGGIADFINGTKKFLDDHYADFVWLSDRWLCRQVMDSRCRFVILGSHPGLGQLGHKERQYDVVHMSYATPRRSRIWARLTDRKVWIADNAWGPERDNALRRSKFMVNVHQDDWPVIEPLRFALCAAYGLPMITEEIKDAYPYTRQGPGHYCVQATYHDLAETVYKALGTDTDYAPYRAMGVRMREAMTTEFEFGRQVHLAVKDLLDGSVDMVIR